MGFERGALSYTMFYVPGGLPGDAMARFSGHAAPPIQTLGHAAIEGWVTSRHLLDNDINDATWRVAGYPFLYLMKAERRIPAALLRAECRMEELALMQAEKRAYLKRSERSDIKKSVVERLLPAMPPTLRGMALVIDDRTQMAYATATTDKQIDTLATAFERTLGRPLIPCTPGAAAVHRHRLDLRDLRPTCFVPDFELAGEPGTVGQDFLTWLWFVSETRHPARAIDLGDTGEVAVMIEGPLRFEFQGEGAHETRLRNGAPLVAYEARAALLAGKKLTQARLTLARDDRLWTATLDGTSFVLRGMKLPKGDAQDPVGRFEERVMATRTFHDTLMALFDLFIRERVDETAWERTCKEIFQWVEHRAAKR